MTIKATMHVQGGVVAVPRAASVRTGRALKGMCRPAMCTASQRSSLSCAAILAQDPPGSQTVQQVMNTR